VSVIRRRVWLYIILLAALSLPVALTFAVPLIESAGWPDASRAGRWFFHKVCHQRTERSFHVAGSPLAVCARCTGVYLGLLSGALLLPVHGWFLRLIQPARKRLLLFLILPGVLHPLAGWLGLVPDLPLVRAATAFMAAAATACLLVPALMEALMPALAPSKGDTHAEA
jgi:uncharacterized membrane protein